MRSACRSIRAHTLTTALTPLKLPEGAACGLRKERPQREAGGSPGEARDQPGREPGGHRAQQPSAAGRRSRRFRGGPAALLRPGRRQLAGLDRTALEPVQRLQRQGAHRGKQVRAAPERGRAGARRVPPSGCRSAARTPICAPPSSASRSRKHPSRRRKRVFASRRTATKPE